MKSTTTLYTVYTFARGRMKINLRRLKIALKYILAIVRTAFPIRGYIRKPVSHVDRSRKTVLIVSHEASRTGAPILALNLARKLNVRYNVVSLLLADGPLTRDFIQASNAVFCLHPQARILAAWLVKIACSHSKPDLAFINSAASAPVLPFLTKSSVPTVTLVHEFSSYAKPLMEILLRWSTRTVFSTRMTKEDAMHHFPQWRSHSRCHIIPQGRSIIDHDTFETGVDVQPFGMATLQDEEIIVGLGQVQLRKGCDLFIQRAQQISKRSPHRKYRFFWIGQGFDPNTDLGYSTYLAEQIRRSGLTNRVQFLDEMASLDAVYRDASLILLTSRLDPLPNVGIDAICLGIPLVVFKDATGLSDVLIESGLGTDCVAPHQDATAMAELAIKLLEDGERQRIITARLREIGRATFNMETYFSSLLAIADLALEDIENEEADVSAIVNRGAFDLRWWSESRLMRVSLKKAVRMYVRETASGIRRRGPNAHFDPEKFALLNPTAGDAYASFLNSGKPPGPWET